ncbi:uncharacterized protein LOC135098307 isoform X3 [Scylla paramamosain]|uniref:uncharacterized protein LOC135098307 isoform X3 n=1 Tax=Scylla paramamosain TaxID=85552 RepID=UPI00308297A5
MLVEGNEAAMANIPEVCDGHTLSQDGLTPLHAAALCGAPSAAVEALLRRGVSPHVTTPDNMTPADLARQQGQDSVIKGLQHHHCVQMMISANRKHEDPYSLEIHNAPPTLDTMARLERYIPPLYKVSKECVTMLRNKPIRGAPLDFTGVL